MNKKRCSKCKEWKDVAEFGKNRSTKDGLRNMCRACNKEAQRKYQNKRYKKDTVYRLKMKTHAMIWNYWKGKTGHLQYDDAMFIIRLSMEQFQEHLKKTYEDRYGEPYDGITKVEIDHIRPLCGADTETAVINLTHYTNLQLLKKEDNARKGSSQAWGIKDGVFCWESE